MTRVETPIVTPIENQATEASNDSLFEQEHNLRACVSKAMEKYFRELDGQMPTDVYQLVLAQVEAPLLEQVMAYTRNNQTRAATMLGLNRGTLRKKLKQYKLIGSDD
ncbi:MAG: DNA-binding transcriptional regulator Fis [Pseudomonadota bacterium]